MNQDLEDLIERWPLVKEFSLPADSIVVVVGAYKGITMDLLDELYHPSLIYGFEPQPWAAKEAFERLKEKFPRLQVYNAALGVTEGDYEMGEWGTDACSLVNTGPSAREHGIVHVVPAETYFNNIPHCDLMVMNIEGYEFTLLPHMRAQEILKKVDRLAVQWHTDLAPGLDETMVARYIDELYVVDEFMLKRDERPAWTYHVKVEG